MLATEILKKFLHQTFKELNHIPPCFPQTPSDRVERVTFTSRVPLGIERSVSFCKSMHGAGLVSSPHAIVASVSLRSCSHFSVNCSHRVVNYRRSFHDFCTAKLFSVHSLLTQSEPLQLFSAVALSVEFPLKSKCCSLIDIPLAISPKLRIPE